MYVRKVYISFFDYLSVSLSEVSSTICHSSLRKYCILTTKIISFVDIVCQCRWLLFNFHCLFNTFSMDIAVLNLNRIFLIEKKKDLNKNFADI